MIPNLRFPGGVSHKHLARSYSFSNFNYIFIPNLLCENNFAFSKNMRQVWIRNPSEKCRIEMNYSGCTAAAGILSSPGSASIAF